jgi:phospholipid/cholesterol/gamma-HCH transport system permease protein
MVAIIIDQRLFPQYRVAILPISSVSDDLGRQHGDSMVQRSADVGGGVLVRLLGRWDIRAIRAKPRELLRQLRAAGNQEAAWDLTQIEDIDAAGATLIWQAWNRTRPLSLSLRTEDAWAFDNLAALSSPKAGGSASERARVNVWQGPLEVLGASADVIRLLGAAVLDSAHMLLSFRDIPAREISATIFRSGAQAVAVSGLVGFLIGIVLSYLSGQELRDIGAESYVINLTGFAVLRELGPLLAAILNAGRSGSAMTAQIGVMRVTGELEAMSVLGISHVRRLLVPKMIGQFIALPLVVVWTDCAAIIGGMIGAQLQLGIPFSEFLHELVRIVPFSNVWFGVCKGALFGVLVALISCYFGFRVRPDTESLAAGTTRAVVTALTAVLLVDAVLAIAFSDLGM